VGDVLKNLHGGKTYFKRYSPSKNRQTGELEVEQEPLTSYQHTFTGEHITKKDPLDHFVFVSEGAHYTATSPSAMNIRTFIHDEKEIHIEDYKTYVL